MRSKRLISLKKRSGKASNKPWNRPGVNRGQLSDFVTNMSDFISTELYFFVRALKIVVLQQFYKV